MTVTSEYSIQKESLMLSDHSIFRKLKKKEKEQNLLFLLF